MTIYDGGAAYCYKQKPLSNDSSISSICVSVVILTSFRSYKHNTIMIFTGFVILGYKRHWSVSVHFGGFTCKNITLIFKWLPAGCPINYQNIKGKPVCHFVFVVHLWSLMTSWTSEIFLSRFIANRTFSISADKNVSFTRLCFLYNREWGRDDTMSRCVWHHVTLCTSSPLWQPPGAPVLCRCWRIWGPMSGFGLIQQTSKKFRWWAPN